MPTNVGGLRTLIRQVLLQISSIPQGFTSLISGTVEDGNLNFHLGAAAGQNAFVKYGTPETNSYKTTACGEIEAAWGQRNCECNFDRSERAICELFIRPWT